MEEEKNKKIPVRSYKMKEKPMKKKPIMKEIVMPGRLKEKPVRKPTMKVEFASTKRSKLPSRKKKGR